MNLKPLESSWSCAATLPDRISRRISRITEGEGRSRQRGSAVLDQRLEVALTQGLRHFARPEEGISSYSVR